MWLNNDSRSVNTYLVYPYLWPIKMNKCSTTLRDLFKCLSLFACIMPPLVATFSTIATHFWLRSSYYVRRYRTEKIPILPGFEPGSPAAKTSMPPTRQWERPLTITKMYNTSNHMSMIYIRSFMIHILYMNHGCLDLSIIRWNKSELWIST